MTNARTTSSTGTKGRAHTKRTKGRAHTKRTKRTKRTNGRVRARRPRTTLATTSTIWKFLYNFLGDDFHAKRILSIRNGVIGILRAAALGIHAIGRGLAAALDLDEKHAVKQVDRLIGNKKIVLDSFFSLWVPFLLTGRPEVIVNLDWTDFDDDAQTMLVASVQTHHGRSTPLLWKSVFKNTLKNRQAEYEDELVTRFAEILLDSGLGKIKVTIVADRGFCDHLFYLLLKDLLGFEFIIRFRGNILVTSAEGETRKAKDWVGPHGRMTVLRSAFVTGKRFPVAMVVCVQDRGMKAPWCLAVSDPSVTPELAKKRYGKRFTIEESFRDIKDIRYGLAMDWRKIGSTDRRDRMMMLAVLAIALLTMLGEAGERIGMDRLLKTNTSKKRQLSLFRQGLRWYDHIPTMKDEQLKPLMESFYEVMREHELCKQILGAI